MTFSEAVKDGFDHYTKFDGRAGRPAFWWWFLFGILVAIGANIIDAIIGTWGVVNGLAALALLLPNFSVAIRRLHDTDHSGWWILIGLIPIVGFIVLLDLLPARGRSRVRTSTGRLPWRESRHPAPPDQPLTERAVRASG